MLQKKIDADLFNEIPISSRDLEELIYFSLLKYNEDKLHRSGVSSKRDSYGAYLERWLNRIVEKKIFEHILNIYNKDYKVCIDNLIYKEGHEKNTPDIIGLEKNQLFPFGKFENNRWCHDVSKPKIEIKAIRSTQNLISVRDTQINDYYCFVETNFRDDYITSFFDKNIFSKEIFESVISQMDLRFLSGDRNDKIILNPNYINYSNEIGHIKLIGIFSHENFINYTKLCNPNEEPYYLAEIEQDPKKIPKKIDRGTHSNFSHNRPTIDKNDLSLPVYVDHLQNYELIHDTYKSSSYFKVLNADRIWDTSVDKGIIKLKYKKFERTSKWTEHVGCRKNFFFNVPDSTEDLLLKFDSIMN